MLPYAPWYFAVIGGFPNYHSHKLSCSIAYSLWVLNMTDWALKKICNGDHRAQETRTCFPGIIGENSVVYRRQLRGCEPWETLRTCHNLNPPNPIVCCQWIFKTIWNLWIFHKTSVFHYNSFCLNICWVSFVVMLYKNFSLSSRAGKYHVAEPINNR